MNLIFLVLHFLFWSPYIGYIFLLALALGFTHRLLQRKADNWDLGYSYKWFNKFLIILLNTWEVESMKGVRFDKPHDYICKCDKSQPKEAQVIFKVKFLSAVQQAKIRDMLYTVTGIGASRKEVLLTGTATNDALELGLIGWENFNYEDSGEPIAFSKENFSCIPPLERDEIANHVRGATEGEGG